MNKQQQTFAAHLRSQGLTFTPARKTVLRQAFAGATHFQADELYLRLAQNKGPTVSRATVYRTLRLLCECRLLRKVAFVDRHSHYEHLFGHDHLICSKCGKVIEFRDQSVSRALEKVCKAKKFRPASRKVEVVGLCAKCNSQ